MAKLRTLKSGDLEPTAVLFDRYRQFYGQPSDLDAARTFISERLANGDSYLIGAFEADEAIGFTQLYPSFSSVAMRPKLILNDMYVLETCRKRGVAQALLGAAEALARRLGAVGLVLATQKDNTAAKTLYVKAGWVEESDFVYFNRKIQGG